MKSSKADGCKTIPMPAYAVIPKYVLGPGRLSYVVNFFLIMLSHGPRGTVGMKEFLQTRHIVGTQLKVAASL